MDARHRIVIYQARRWAGSDEVRAAIEASTEMTREAVTSLLETGPSSRLENLETRAAEELARVLTALGVDVDLEPMTAEPSRLDWLTDEVPKWVKRGLVHPASVPRIFENYGAAPPAVEAPVAAVARTRKHEVGAGTLLRAVLTLGAVLVGLGMVLFIAANWQKVPAPARIGGALALTLVALHLGSRFRYGRAPRPRLGAALLLMALFGVGGVVILIGQIYHLQADSHVLPLVWGGLAVPVALFLRFRPATYLASGLWFWAFWLYYDSRDAAPWFYPVLLLGFLLPYSVLVKDKWLYGTHVALVGVAILSALAMQEFWLCTVLVLGLVALRVRFHQPLYDWLVVAGVGLWHVAFLMEFDDLPNVLYALPLGFFFYRAARTRSNALMIATVLNAWLWLVTVVLQTIERFDLPAVSATGFVLWTLATGLLWFGIGKRLEISGTWLSLSTFLRAGGAALAALMVYVLSFRFYGDEADFYRSPLLLVATALFGATGLALSVPVLLRNPASRDRRSTLALLGLVCLSLLLTFLAEPGLPIHVALFNLALFVGALLSMLKGHHAPSLFWFNVGIAIFVVLITSRYFDTLVEYLPRSIFFVLGGLFLIVWAVLVERQRRRLDGRLGAEDV